MQSQLRLRRPDACRHDQPLARFGQRASLRAFRGQQLAQHVLQLWRAVRHMLEQLVPQTGAPAAGGPADVRIPRR